METPRLRHCLQTEGVQGLYKGLSAPLAAQAVYKAVIFGVNSTMRGVLDGRGGDAGIFLCGAVSGAVNSFVVSPVELVRSKLMVQYGQSSAAGGVHYKGPGDVISSVLKARGWGGLWHGIGPTVLRDGPGMGFYFISFEYSKRALAPTDGSPLSFSRLLLAGCTAGVS